MRIKFGEHILGLNALENEEYIKSKLVDKDLHFFSHTVSVKGNSLESFRNTLENSEYGGVYSLDDNGNSLKEYKVSNEGYSHRGNNLDGDTTYSYNLRFEEVVKVNLENLKLSELIITPYDFKQEYDNGIIIEASVKLADEEMKIFKKIQDGDKYFDVIRHGISENIVRMRFGQVIWSQHADFCKVKIVLVEECYDKEEKNNGMFQPELSNIKHMLAYQKNLNDELINLLLNKSIINETELEVIKDKADKNIHDTFRLFYKVEDIDLF